MRQNYARPEFGIQKNTIFVGTYIEDFPRPKLLNCQSKFDELNININIP